MQHDDPFGDEASAGNASADDRGGRGSGYSSSGAPGGGPGEMFGELFGAGLRDALRGGRSGGARGDEAGGGPRGGFGGGRSDGRSDSRNGGLGGGLGAGLGAGSALFERIVGDVSSWFDDERDDARRSGEAARSGSAGTRGASRRAERDGDSGGGDGERDPAAAARERANRVAPPAPADDYDDESRATLHRGHGPKGYRRSDERLIELVNEALHDADDLDARDVEVSAKQGDVKLAGRTPTRRQKHRAENLAARVAGVHDVDNRLRVEREVGDRDPGVGSVDDDGQPGGKPGEAARDDDDYGHPR